MDFDHVKNSLKVDDEGRFYLYLLPLASISFRNHDSIMILTSQIILAELEKMQSDPTYNINVSGDIKQMLKELGTEKAKEIALHGGGGSKARDERAAALEAILAARSRIKEDKSDDAKTKQVYSVVDAASASVHGRSAAAAKSASSDKVAARIALHMAGERAPVNAKLVSSFII